MNHRTHLDDLQVEEIDNALKGIEIDLVITGSIAATESVKFIRSLRRLGAEINVWVTKAALQFTTVTSLEWASGRPVWIKFSGVHSHIGQADACIIAPCSASFASRIAMGLSDTPCAALVTSYLGQDKPVLMIPTMHQSLRDSPIIENNFQSLKEKITILSPDQIESKLKFPDPNILAERVAHELNHHLKFSKKPAGVLLAYGGASENLDPVRKLTNISTGKLGSELSDYLYRRGVMVESFRGSSEHKRKDDLFEKRFSHNEDLFEKIKDKLRSSPQSVQLIVLAAALSDFGFENTTDKKISSSDHTHLSISLIKKSKVIQEIRKIYSGKLIGFKLLDLKYKTNSAWIEIAKEYVKSYKLDGIYVNFHEELSTTDRKGFFFDDTFKTLEVENTKNLGEIMMKRFFNFCP